MRKQSFNRFSKNRMMTLTTDKVRYDLAESVGPDLLLSDVLASDEYAEVAGLSLEYGNAHGDAGLRTFIAGQHGVQADQVITTVGGMHAIFLCGAILCGDADHVLVQQPAFPLTESALSFGRATLEYLPCRFEGGYRVDVEDLLSRLTPQTSLVCLASPQNPSGVSVPRQSIVEILNAMHEYCPDAFLLLDETYRQASYSDSCQRESLVGLDERVISCASLSKCHGAPGLRVGWAITRHNALMQQLINGKFQTVICCSGLDEAIALRVLRASEALAGRRQQHLRDGRDMVGAWVARHPQQLAWVPPDAGALCCVRLNPEVFDSRAVQQFHEQLQQHSVRLAPGDWFGDSPGVFRLGFGLLPLSQLAEGLEIISHVLKNNG